MEVTKEEVDKAKAAANDAANAATAAWNKYWELKEAYENANNRALEKKLVLKSTSFNFFS